MDSVQGRWTSPDPYAGSMSFSDPQSFNRYTYVGNDPVNFVDPTGLIQLAPKPIKLPTHPQREEIFIFIISTGPAGMDMSGTEGGSPLAQIPYAIPCPPTPISPPGVDIVANIKIARAQRLALELSSLKDDLLSTISKTVALLLWFQNMVQTNGPWDFKNQNKTALKDGKNVYEDFGNFHYGAVGAAIGIGRDFLIRQAGYNQQQSPDPNNRAVGSGEMGILHNGFGGVTPYGDALDDMANIVDGFEFYQLLIQGCEDPSTGNKMLD